MDLLERKEKIKEILKGLTYDEIKQIFTAIQLEILKTIKFN